MANFSYIVETVHSSLDSDGWRRDVIARRIIVGKPEVVGFIEECRQTGVVGTAGDNEVFINAYECGEDGLWNNNMIIGDFAGNEERTASPE